jgi:hypothetical protein
LFYNQGVSKRLVSRIVLAGLLLAAAGSASYAFANGDALTALRDDALVASDVPSLLGPIDERGRVGWECKPERAAQSSSPTMGELPQAPH